MSTVREVMDKGPLMIAPDRPVRELAELLMQTHIDGACVIDADGTLRGVVTTMDLIFQEKRVHLPTVFYFLDAVIPLESEARTKAELAKIAGGKVSDVMTPDPITIGPEADLADAATLMVEKHISLLPVVEDGKLIGAVTKPALLHAAYRR